MSGRRAIAMSPVQVEAFLRLHCRLTLGTIGPQGAPHMSTVSYGMRADVVNIVSFTKSQKVVNLGRNPVVTCLIEENPDDYFAIRGILVTGTATLLDRIDEVVEARAAVVAARRRILGEDAFEPEDDTTMYAGKRSVIALRPERVVSWDHTKLGGTY